LGTQFITYSDAALLDDGSVDVFAASQDLSQYSAVADVQMSTTITMPDGSISLLGDSSRSGYVMVHQSVPAAAFAQGGIVEVDSQHELNWPGCDGYGTILLSSLQFEVATTKTATDWSNGKTDTVTTSDGKVYCAQTNWCTPETTPPACGPSFVLQSPVIAGAPASCSDFYTTTWLAERHGSSGSWNCFPLPIIGQNAVGSYDRSLGVCTKQ
jgi:hypothetical protein